MLTPDDANAGRTSDQPNNKARTIAMLRCMPFECTAAWNYEGSGPAGVHPNIRMD
jgi:hypothetical protein